MKDKGKQAKAALLDEQIPALYPKPPKNPEDDDSRYRSSFLEDRYLCVSVHCTEDGQC